MSHPELLPDLSQAVWFHSRRQRPYGGFSNFEPTEIFVAGRRYPTVEHWYQSQRAASPMDQEQIANASTSGAAKALGRSVAAREDWERRKLGVMYRGLISKFRQHPELGALLLATGDRPIHEDADDPFWGFAGGRGEDWLGRLLETVRCQLRTTLGRVPDHRTRAGLSGTFSVGWQIAAGVRAAMSGGTAWLTHLIRTPNCRATAVEILRDLVASGVLGGSEVMPGVRATCFSASPWRAMAERVWGVDGELRRQHGVRPLTGWGVAIPFDIAREMGAEPVIPVSSRDIADLPARMRWRISLYGAAEQRDWTYEDEWRLLGDVQLVRRITVLLVADEGIASEFAEAGWRTASLR
jgi:N-glycosidase YbiA